MIQRAFEQVGQWGSEDCSLVNVWELTTFVVEQGDLLGQPVFMFYLFGSSCGMSVHIRVSCFPQLHAEGPNDCYHFGEPCFRSGQGDGVGRRELIGIADGNGETAVEDLKASYFLDVSQELRCYGGVWWNRCIVGFV